MAHPKISWIYPEGMTEIRSLEQIRLLKPMKDIIEIMYRELSRKWNDMVLYINHEVIMEEGNVTEVHQLFEGEEGKDKHVLQSVVRSDERKDSGRKEFVKKIMMMMRKSCGR